MKARCAWLVFVAVMGIGSLGRLVADDRHDRDALDRYHAAMDSIWNSAFDTSDEADCFAAIAYSPATGKYGYSYNYSSRSAAMRRALTQCPQADAKIVGWVEGGY